MIAMGRRLHADERGFTLVELMVVVFLLAIVGGVTMTGLTAAMRMQRSQTEHIDALNRSKTAMERVTKELRGANPVLDASADSVRLEIKDTVQERTTLYTVVATPTAGVACSAARRCLVQSGTVTDTSTGVTTTLPPRVVLSDIATAAGETVFTFYEADGSLITDVPVPVDEVAAVQVNMRVGLSPDPTTAPTLRTSNLVSLRNFKETP